MKKRNINSKHIFAVLFSLIIFFFMFTVFERFVRFAILNQYPQDLILSETEYSQDAENCTDWSKVYPFSESETEEPAAAPAEKPVQPGFFETLKNSYTERAEYLKSGIDYYTSKLLAFRMDFIEFNAKFNKTIGMKLISGADDIVVLADGNLSYYPCEYDITKSAENLVDFSDFVKENGAELIYVQAPSKVDPDNNYLPGGIKDYDNEKADELLKILNKNRVNCLDLRASMKAQSMNYTESFYRTDHHWKTGVGLWAAKQISEALSKYGIPYNEIMLSPDSYNEKTYRNYMLGSLGKQVTLAYTDPEDISIYTPKFHTDFTADYYDFGLHEGTFEEAMLDMSVFNRIDYYNTSTYSSYLYGVTPVTSIENHLDDNNKRILIISDSFCHCVVPYLATQVKYIDKLDTRYFNGSVRNFIETTKPDAVIVMFYPGTLNYSAYSVMSFR